MQLIPTEMRTQLDSEDSFLKGSVYFLAITGEGNTAHFIYRIVESNLKLGG